MVYISYLLKNIKNLLPYFLLIAIYFFFVNLEARKEKGNFQNNDKENILPKDTSKIDEQFLKIRIPVIPYNQ